MLKVLIKLFIIFISYFVLTKAAENNVVGPKESLIYGHGLKPDEVVLPARYFFIHASSPEGVL